MTPEPLTHADAPDMAAAYWFNRKRGGEMSADDIRAFEVWLSDDAGHRAAYDELERIWEVFGAVVDDPAIMASREANARALRRGAGLRKTGLIAAGLTLATLSGWGLLQSGVLPPVSLFSAAPAQELRTSIGQRTTVMLRDNSFVTLDTDTVVRFRETLRERQVELVRGQAFFQVDKHDRRPFVVTAAGKSVRAIGTAFDVRVEPNRFQVTLIEGRVRVEERAARKPDAPVADMRAGWRLEVGEDAHWRIQPIDITKATSWHDGLLTFFHEPLGEAVTEMNRYSRRKIVFRGEPSQAPVVGVFPAGDVENFVRAVELNKLAKVAARTDDRIELTAE